VAENEKEDKKAVDSNAAPQEKIKPRKFSFDQLKGGKIHPQGPKNLRSRLTRGSNRGR
jgi:hypothetical protein